MSLLLAAGGQPLTPGLLTNTNTFFGPTITTGVVTLTPDLFTNQQTHYAPTVTPGVVTLTPALLDNTNAFFAPTVTSGAATLTPDLFTNNQTFFAPTVSTGGVTIEPPLFTDTSTLFSPTVTTGGVTVEPELFTNEQTFYAPTVSTTVEEAAPALTGGGWLPTKASERAEKKRLARQIAEEEDLDRVVRGAQRKAHGRTEEEVDEPQAADTALVPSDALPPTPPRALPAPSSLDWTALTREISETRLRVTLADTHNALKEDERQLELEHELAVRLQAQEEEDLMLLMAA